MFKTRKQMTVRHSLFKFAVFLTLSIFPAQGFAQGDTLGMKKADAPIEAEITPAVVPPGKPIKIKGSTIADGKRFDVKAIIKPPNGAPITLTEKIDAKGNFEFEFLETASFGKYTVKLTAPDGKGTLGKSFKVLSFSGIFAESAETLTEIADISKEFAKRGEKIVSTQVPSDETRELKSKTDELKRHLADSEQVIGKYVSALNDLSLLIENNPEIATAFQDFAVNLAAETEKSKAAVEKARRELADSEKRGEVCDQLDMLNEAFNAVGFMLNLTTNPIGLAVNFAIDKGLPRGIDAAISKETGLPPTSAKKFAITEGLKNYAAHLAGGAQALTPAGWAGIGIGLANGAAQFAAQNLFVKVCERFEGPISGTFKVVNYDKGVFFWSYEMTLRGKITTQFAKRKNPTEAAKFKGRIEGNVTDIKIVDNTFGTFNKTVQKSLIAKKITTPITIPYIEDFGLAARTATPGFFNLPIMGEIIDNQLSFKWLPPATDFSERFKGKAMFVMLTPVLPIPQIITADMPFQNAEFIFTRGLGANPKIDLVKDAAKKEVTAQKVFERKHDSPSFKLNIEIDVKACSPGCLNNKIVEN